MNTKSRLCTYGSACEQENRHSVQVPDTKHFTAMPADSAHIPPSNTGAETSIQDAPRCIMKQNSDSLRPLPMLHGEAQGRGNQQCKFTFQNSFLIKYLVAYSNHGLSTLSHGQSFQQPQLGWPEVTVGPAGVSELGPSAPPSESVWPDTPRFPNTNLKFAQTKKSSIPFKTASFSTSVIHIVYFSTYTRLCLLSQTPLPPPKWIFQQKWSIW